MATPPEAVAVAEQLENPVGKVMIGVAGTVNAELNVTVIVLPAARAPLDEVVKPSVQVAVEPAVCGEPEKVTAVTEVAVITTAEAGFAAAVSFEVATLKVLASRCRPPGS